MSNLLIEDRPIMFLPSLAKALGSCERAIVLQQIHWLSRLPNSGLWDDDGLHWVWGTYDEWCRDYFTMWSPHTLRKHIQKLETDGVLISAQLRAHLHDRTKFYRINYTHERLNQPVAPMRPDAVDSMRPDVIPSNQPDAVDSLYRTKTSTENTPQGEMRPPRAQEPRRRDDDSPRKYSREHYPDL
jgi:hypothetical protein